MRARAVLGNRPEFVLNDEGAASLVVCLPNEYASEVMARAEAVEGPVNVLIASAKHFEVMTISRSVVAKSEPMLINRDLSMGMLPIKMKAHPNDIFRLQFRDASLDVPAVTRELECG